MALCALLLGLGASAQHRTQTPVRGDENRTELSSQQRATLQSKRLTLALGLDKGQQDRIAALLKSRVEERMEWRAGRNAETSSEPKERESRYVAMNDRLDREIAFQENMKGILSDTQFEQWRSLRENRLRERNRKMGGRDRQRHHPGPGRHK